MIPKTGPSRRPPIRTSSWLTVLEGAAWLLLLAVPFGLVGMLAHHYPDWVVRTAEVGSTMGIVAASGVRFRWNHVTRRAQIGRAHV